MKQFLIGLVVGLGVAFGASAWGAAFQNGNKLLDFMKADSTFAAGYVAGAVDGALIWLGNTELGRHASPICVPNGVSVQQLTDLTEKYLDDHPEDRHYTAASLVHYAVAADFPCEPETAP